MIRFSSIGSSLSPVPLVRDLGLSRRSASPLLEHGAQTVGRTREPPARLASPRTSSVASEVGQLRAQLAAAVELQAKVEVAQVGLDEQLAILERIRAVVEPGTTATWTTEEVDAAQLQVDALVEELDAVAARTKYDGQRVLDGSLSAATVALGGGQTVSVSIPALSLSGLEIRPNAGNFNEAEVGVVDGGFVIADDPTASGGQYLWTPNGTGSFRGYTSTYTFSLTQPGTYRIRGEVYSPNGNDNSFFISLNGESAKEVQFSYRSFFRPEYFGADAYELEAGTHTLVLVQREDGTRLDTIELELQGQSAVSSPRGGAQLALATVDDAIAQATAAISTTDSAVSRIEENRSRLLGAQASLRAQVRQEAAAKAERTYRDAGTRAIESFYRAQATRGGVSLISSVSGASTSTASFEASSSTTSFSELTARVHDLRRQGVLRAFGVNE